MIETGQSLQHEMDWIQIRCSMWLSLQVCHETEQPTANEKMWSGKAKSWLLVSNLQFRSCFFWRRCLISVVVKCQHHYFSPIQMKQRLLFFCVGRAWLPILHRKKCLWHLCQCGRFSGLGFRACRMIEGLYRKLLLAVPPSQKVERCHPNRKEFCNYIFFSFQGWKCYSSTQCSKLVATGEVLIEQKCGVTSSSKNGCHTKTCA